MPMPRKLTLSEPIFSENPLNGTRHIEINVTVPGNDYTFIIRQVARGSKIEQALIGLGGEWADLMNILSEARNAS